jgi:hypothetical protein
MTNNQKNEYNFKMVYDAQEQCTEPKSEAVVELSNGDVTFGLARLSAILTAEKSQITCERYTLDPKHVLNTNRKQ